MEAILMLQDGRSFVGQARGAIGEKVGEVVFNTAVVGFQEMITDPVYAGKILVLTYPLIGNYGVAPKFNQSKGAWLAGLVVKEFSRMYSNWQAKDGLEDFLKQNKVPALFGVDTRTLTVHLRNKGTMLGIISTQHSDSKTLLAKISQYAKEKQPSILPRVSVSRPTMAGKKNAKVKLALLDLGVNAATLRQLELQGAAVTLLPYNTGPEGILRLRPKGLVISSGPEADAGLEAVTSSIKPLIGKLPILGIAAGCQVLARALGAKVTKMKLGHNGVNYPVQNPLLYKGEITAQRHGYTIDADSLSRLKEVKASSCNMNDRSVEEIESKKLRLLGVQYLPLSPGFDEVNPVFGRFLKMASQK